MNLAFKRLCFVMVKGKARFNLSVWLLKHIKSGRGVENPSQMENGLIIKSSYFNLHCLV